MTSKHTSWDDRVVRTTPTGANYLYGNFGHVDQEGVNWTVKGQRDPHNYDCDRLTQFHGDAAIKKIVRDTGEVLYEGRTNFFSALDVVQPSLSSDQVAKLFNKLASKIQDAPFDTGTFTGELGESVDLLADSFRSLVGGIRSLRKGDLPGAAKALGVPNRVKKLPKTLGDAWMSYRYGWQPIVNDIYNLSDQIQRQDKPRKVRVVAREFVGGRIYNIGGAFPIKGSSRIQRQIIALLEEPERSLANRLGLENPASVAWELLPWSFVVDWAFPIGNYLQTRSILADAKATYIDTTTTKWSGTFTSGSRVIPDGPYDLLLSDPTGFVSYVNVRRRVSNSIAVPLPQLRNPAGGNPFTRAVDALNLFVSGFRTLRG